MLRTCVSAVFSLMTNSPAILRLLKPRATSAMTWRSRDVNAPLLAGPRFAGAGMGMLVEVIERAQLIVTAGHGRGQRVVTGHGRDRGRRFDVRRPKMALIQMATAYTRTFQPPSHHRSSHDLFLCLDSWKKSVSRGDCLRSRTWATSVPYGP